MRGKSGTGDGVHVLTGPVYVCGAEPGDVLQIDIMDLKPRKNPSTGKTYGSNAAAWWGKFSNYISKLSFFYSLSFLNSIF